MFKRKLAELVPALLFPGLLYPFLLKSRGAEISQVSGDNLRKSAIPGEKKTQGNSWHIILKKTREIFIFDKFMRTTLI